MGRSGLEQPAYIDVGQLRVVELEQLKRFEIEHARDDDVGELFDADVIEVDRFVIELSPIGDGVFEPGDASFRCWKVSLAFRSG